MPAEKSTDKVMDTLEPQVRLKQLIEYSNQVEADPNISPLRYYRSGQEMVRMATVYYKEGSLENAYVLYLKFMTLFLEKIRKHPGFGSIAVEVKAKNQATLREVLPKAEKIKQQLLEQYTIDYKRCVAERKKIALEQKRKEEEKAAYLEAAAAKAKQNRSLSVKTIDVANIPDNLDDINYPMETETPATPPTKPPTPRTPPPRTPPPRTPPPRAITPPATTIQIPPVPPPSTILTPKVPKVDRSKKPSDTIATGRYDSNILRPVVVPVQVMTLFQAVAQSNTFKNIETCGVLCGKLEKNELIITHLILPKQKGTSDSCSATNEEEIFEYQDLHNLITIGWIHTHPTQSVFLSSIDLHTHCPYQLLMPEAIAIVCSPKYNETGIFTLTPNHGLQFIANCRKNAGSFHSHPTDPPLYIEADHVRVENNAPLEILDLRKK